jgi:hypothetical protein
MMKKIMLMIIFLFSSNLSICQDFSGSLIYQAANTVRAGAFYQSLKIGDEKINQMAFPVSLTIPIASSFTMNIVNNPAMSKSDMADINGLTETKIGLRYVTLGEKLLFKVIAGLPTGKTKYTIDQFNLAKFLSTNSLDYYVSYYGRGMNANIGASYAQPVTKSLVLGAGVSYYYKGTFYPLDLPSGGKYDAGDEITANLGMDYLFDRWTRFNIDLIYTNYMTDKIDGVNKFQAAPKLTIYSGFQFKYGRSTHSIFILDRLKSDNKLYMHGEEFLAKSGNQLDIGYDGVIPINFDLSILLNLDGKFYGDIQQMVVGDMFETGKTNIYSAGLGLRIFFTDVIILDIVGKYRTGKITIIQGNVSNEKNVSGFGGIAGLSFKF